MNNVNQEHSITIYPYSVTNPPFGVRSTLAKTFIKHSINLGAETIAFILPKTFNKRLNHFLIHTPPATIIPATKINGLNGVLC